MCRIAWHTFLVLFPLPSMPILMPPVIALCGVGYALLSIIDYIDRFV